ncbi:hypothetical protein [Methylobacterium sp. 391_Methyba4]|uniref:hypothetical protein n=1 Tax=Methylobacterium sp. 391_Methyba4 TaxID=3038924 RepID=UPI00241C1526|nr:hypothetical protein [Methylobacterium sp. 391_Methyba4]WFS05403.1 hypothetical protein P9K36_18455 [Methylobacterium sp. 391_Methyba4]
MMDTETVWVPGLATFARTYAVPPISVGLPLEVRTRVGWQLLYAFLAFAAGLVSILVIIVAIWLAASYPAEWVTWVVALSCLPPSFVGGISGPAIAWNCLKDAARSDPVLIVRADGLEDRRARAMIPWAAVSEARMVYSYAIGGLNHVHLTLRMPVPAQHNPFRPGTMGYLSRRRPDALQVPVILLDVKAYTLAQIVAALVKRHGGEVTVVGGPMLPG